MKQPSVQELAKTGMDIRRTIATGGKGLGAFARDQSKTRMRNQKKIYSSLPKKTR